MSANVEQMFYVREDGVPWHSEGLALDNPATWEDAVLHGGLDWLVDKLPVFAKRGEQFIEAQGRYALVRSSNNAVLGLVSGYYQPIQNRELFNFVDPLIAENEASFRTAGVIGQGERVWALAKLSDTIDVRAGDKLDFYLLLTAAHDGKHSADFMLTSVRVVCENTFNAAYGEAASGARGVVKVRHTGDTKGKMQEAHRILGISRGAIQQVQKDAAALVSTPLTKDRAKAVLEYTFQTPEPKAGERPEDFASRVGRTVALRERSYELAFTGKGNNGSSLWDLVQGVCDHVDHELVTRSRKSALLYTQEAEGNHTKSRAMEMGVKIAGGSAGSGLLDAILG
jgi:phage/plasmid-like protein (TIGR03299 family)